MSGFFSKLFGGGKKKESGADGSAAVELIQKVTTELIERTGLDLSFTVDTQMVEGVEEVALNLSGNDQELLTEKEGALLDSIQLFVKRVVQHQLPDSKVDCSIDCDGFREETNRSLVELAEKLKERALEQNRSVYLRALAPKDRKVVHQHLATDERVRSRSVGEGLFKKIKIYPVRAGGREAGSSRDEGHSDTDAESV